MKYLCTVSYKGTNYQGWQKQKDASSVQETIEKVISKILDKETPIYGSGRTDAGVHALGQTFHFETDKDLDLGKFKYSVNCLLPEDIFFSEISAVSDDFHARYSAKSKTYSYRIRFGERNPLKYELETCIPFDLDINLLFDSLKLFKGEHNFKDFTSKEEDENDFVRTIFDVQTFYDDGEGLFEIIFSGNGFMRYQIRNMVGAAIAVASGKEDISYIAKHLDSKSSREIVSYKAEPQGLYLVSVNY